MFCNKIYDCKNANWCARNFNPKSDDPECFEQMTNYDWLISKTPDELAEWIETITECEKCPNWSVNKENVHELCAGENAVSRASCKLHWRNWLNSKVEGDI